MSTASPQRTRRAAATRRKVVLDSDDESSPKPQTNEEEDDFTPAPQSPRKTTRRRTTATEATTPKRTTRRSKAVLDESTILSPPETMPEPPSPAKKPSPRKRASARPSIRATRQARLSVAPEPIEERPKDTKSKSGSLPTPQPSISPEPEQETEIEADTIVGASDVSLEPTEATVDASEAAVDASVVTADASDVTIKSDDTVMAPVTIKKEQTPLADITKQVINEQPAPMLQHVKHDVVMVDPNVTKLERPMDIVIRTRQTALPTVQEQAAPKARLVITYLVLNNFKSYAGKQNVGPFHASFSSVVGPNGSGKSNVIDSLLFVFGFRANKMRQDKLSALIHNSAAHPDLDFCEVEVHFQEVMDLPGGGHEVIPDSALMISRKAFKNNSSSYYLNGRTSNYTTVTTLLRERGIDLDHKRFLILQGEVESIAQMKPKADKDNSDGLLEYLEDIIGTSKYKTPIEEAAKETEELNTVCQEKNSRVQIVEKEKKNLESAKETALGYIRDENELSGKQSALYQRCIQECNDSLSASEEVVARIQAELNQEMQNHQGSEGEIKRLEKQYKAASKEFDAIEKRTQAILSEMAKFDKETVKLEEKKKFLSNKQKKLDKSLETSHFATRESETTINQCNDDVERNTQQIAELEQQMKAEEKELAAIRDGLKGKTQGLSDEISAKQKSLEPWNEKINSIQSSKAVAESELEILREKDNAGAVAISDVESKIAGFEETRVQKSSDVEECHSRKAEIEKQIGRINKELAEIGKQEPKLRATLSDARQKADEARASLSASQTQGNVLTGLMRLKDSGRISGFHGRLGNLGAIDAKYDIAISTACPALDNLVVDSVEVGQQCIDYLRKNNLGRANFILLDKLPQRDLSALQTPENVPRLFDLVKPKEDRFRPAFFSVLQNTLVAKDLEHANRIAYGAKRWRVVTLDGQLIDKSGTMSGGGTRVARGAMSSKLAATFSKDQVSKMEVDRDELEKQIQTLLSRKRELEDSLQQLSSEGPKIDTRLQKLELEISSIDRNITDARKRIKELETEQRTTPADKSRVNSLEKSVTSAEKEIAKLHAETADIEAEIKTLQDKIMEIGGVRLRSQKAKVDGLKGQIDTVTEEMTNAEMSRTKAEKNLQKHLKAHKEAEKELAKLAADAEKIDDDIRSQSQVAASSQQESSEAQEAIDTKKDELQALKVELDTKTEELNQSRGVEIEMRNQLEENQKVVTEVKQKLAHYEEAHSKLSYTNLSDLGEEQEVQELPVYSRDELLDLDKKAFKAAIAALKAKLDDTKVDLSVLAEYRRRAAEYTARSADLAEAVAQRDTAKRRCDELRRLRLEGFMEGFSAISLRLKEMYQMITMGGNAELELVDSLDPFSEGILFSVMPPKKSWKNISNLSGGEKTLSSLALVFALHHYKPTPLYVMDEIDAALDFRNVSDITHLLRMISNMHRFRL
jgi:structural maintenance of chromosome 4